MDPTEPLPFAWLRRRHGALPWKLHGAFLPTYMGCPPPPSALHHTEHCTRVEPPGDGLGLRILEVPRQLCGLQLLSAEVNDVMNCRQAPCTTEVEV